MKSLNNHYDVENLGQTTGSESVPGWQSKLQEYVLRAVVVAAGIFLGAILALFIGLFAGWLDMSC